MNGIDRPSWEHGVRQTVALIRNQIACEGYDFRDVDGDDIEQMIAAGPGDIAADCGIDPMSQSTIAAVAELLK